MSITLDINKQLEQVLHWSRTFNLPIKTELTVIPKRAEFGLSLVTSEVNELKKNVNKLLEKSDLGTEEEIIDYLTNVADDCVDSIWVLYRFLMEHGIQDIFPDIFTAAYEANMSKACPTEDIAQETVDYYMETQDIETYYKPVGSLFIIHASKDYPELEIKKDKVLKNKYWFKPDEKIKDIIRKALEDK